MKSHTQYLTFTVPKRMDFINITAQVEAAVQESGVREGLVLINAMHITASVFINDNEPGLHEDYKQWLERLAPFDPSPQTYRHNRTGEDNGDATTSDRSWAGRWLWRSPTANSTSAPGSRFSTASSTAGVPSGCW